MTIEEQVIQIVYDELGSGNEITVDTVVLNGSAIDEDIQRDLVMRLEDEFKVDIIDKDAEKLTSVQTVVDYLTEKLKKERENETND